jgi:hypothetical protein
VNRTTRLMGVTLVGATMVTGTLNLIGAQTAGAHESGRVAPCRVAQIKENLSLSAQNYPPETLVRMSVSILNLSSKSCSMAVGPTSPSLSIVNAKGVVFWNNCYVGDQPGACAMFLRLHVVQPKKSYSFTRSWDQRSGPYSTVVARGGYVLTSNFSGINAQRKILFTLIM